MVRSNTTCRDVTKTPRENVKEEPPVDLTSYIEAVRRADGSAQPGQLSLIDLHVALGRVGTVVPYKYFGFN